MVEFINGPNQANAVFVLEIANLALIAVDYNCELSLFELF